MAYIGSTYKEAIQKLNLECSRENDLIKAIDGNKIKRQNWFNDFESRYSGSLTREVTNLRDFNVKFKKSS